jgi:hypothetical protein
MPTRLGGMAEPLQGGYQPKVDSCGETVCAVLGGCGVGVRRAGGGVHAAAPHRRADGAPLLTFKHPY